MLLDSSASQPGDKVMFLSPQWNFTQPTNLSFYYHLQLNSTDNTAALTVYKYSQLQVLEQQLFTVSGDQSDSWLKTSVCLPVGVYQLAFVGTLGLPYLSDIGLDDIAFETTPSSCVAPTLVNGRGTYLIPVFLSLE